MDKTIVYYTANKIPEHFAENVRNDLLRVIDNANIPIISVSQKPINFGENICVGNIGASAYNVYKQILEGALRVKTKYLICCEDDTLYSMSHFNFIPFNDDTFYYSKSRWILEDYNLFRYRNRTTMCACIVNTEFIIFTLEQRFKKYPIELKGYPWGEPGRVEQHFGLSIPKLCYFETDTPIVTFNHKFGLARPRKAGPTDINKSILFPWGDAGELWRNIHGC